MIYWVNRKKYIIKNYISISPKLDASVVICFSWTREEVINPLFEAGIGRY